MPPLRQRPLPRRAAAALGARARSFSPRASSISPRSCATRCVCVCVCDLCVCVGVCVCARARARAVCVYRSCLATSKASRHGAHVCVRVPFRGVLLSLALAAFEVRTDRAVAACAGLTAAAGFHLPAKQLEAWRLTSGGRCRRIPTRQGKRLSRPLAVPNLPGLPGPHCAILPDACVRAVPGTLRESTRACIPWSALRRFAHRGPRGPGHARARDRSPPA